MFRPRVIPVLLLSGSGLVKTTKFKNPRYIGDPINAVKIFNDLKADELIFLDIESSRRKNNLLSLVAIVFAVSTVKEKASASCKEIVCNEELLVCVTIVVLDKISL